MNRKIFKKAGWLLGIFLVLSVPLFVWLFLQDDTKQSRQGAVKRVTVILPHTNDGYWELIQGGINEAGSRLNETYGIDITSVAPQLNYSIPQMQELVRQQIAAQVDFLVIQGNEDPAFRDILLEAWEQGIQIICMDTDIEDFPEHLYIGTDNYAAGQLLGEELVKLADESGKVLHTAVVSGEAEYLNMAQRLQGLQDAVADEPYVELGEVQYDHYDGVTAMSLFQSLHSEYDVIAFLEGTGGTTLSREFRFDGDYDYVIGFDAHEQVADGVVDGVVWQETHQMGERIVEEIARYISEGSYSADTIFTDISWLTAENYEEVMG